MKRMTQVKPIIWKSNKEGGEIERTFDLLAGEKVKTKVKTSEELEMETIVISVIALIGGIE